MKQCIEKSRKSLIKPHGNIVRIDVIYNPVKHLKMRIIASFRPARVWLIDQYIMLTKKVIRHGKVSQCCYRARKIQ